MAAVDCAAGSDVGKGVVSLPVIFGIKKSLELSLPQSPLFLQLFWCRLEQDRVVGGTLGAKDDGAVVEVLVWACAQKGAGPPDAALGGCGCSGAPFGDVEYAKAMLLGSRIWLSGACALRGRIGGAKRVRG